MYPWGWDMPLSSTVRGHIHTLTHNTHTPQQAMWIKNLRSVFAGRTLMEDQLKQESEKKLIGNLTPSKEGKCYRKLWTSTTNGLQNSNFRLNNLLILKIFL